MKLGTLRTPAGAVTVRIEGDEYVEIPGLPMLDLIASGAEGLARAAEARGPRRPLERARLLAPIPAPRRNLVCLGWNYADHSREAAAARGREVKLPQHPIFFTKATQTVNGPYAMIPYDPAVSEQVDWEAELGVVVGCAGKNIARDEAMAYVFGYTVINDVTARDLQTQHVQFFKGKSLDGFCPMGPWIVTADEIPDPHHLRVRCTVNGVVKQDGNTEQFLFDIPAILASLSRGMTVEAGDIIATGTPSGVGFARTPPEFLKPGDVVETEVESVGVLRNVIGS
jgi:2-keto-4-pentenoate hydratase/2-oxohepta-3-ene-1,7-dioic acid hydratase in catechol pathway